MAVYSSIPNILINGNRIPLEDMSCRRIEISKDVDSIDRVFIECIGDVVLEDIKPKKLDMVFISPTTKQKFRLDVIGVQEIKIDPANVLTKGPEEENIKVEPVED